MAKHTPIGPLVESIRTAQGSRHRVVAYLGELKKRERTGWAQFGQRLNGPGRLEPSLFDPPHYDDPTDDEPVLVKLKNIRLQRLRDFGDVWLALGLWRLLGLDTLLAFSQRLRREDRADPQSGRQGSAVRRVGPQSTFLVIGQPCLRAATCSERT